jgi:hypothetical protein
VSQAYAVNLLIQGDFEIVADPVPQWDLTTVVHGTNTFIGNAEISNNDPVDGVRDLFLKPYVGGIEPGPNNLTDALLTQVVPVLAGQQYTFSGQSRWETNYSGGVTTLGLFSPAYPTSPTDTTLEMQFLNAGGTPVGSPIIKDLRTEQGNFNTWVEHTLNGVAPAGATQLRVTAAAREMVWNGNSLEGPLQSAFWDDFSVTSAAAPATELLLNPSLEDIPPSGLDSWTLFSDDPGNPANEEVIRATGFANNTPGGSSGMWLSSFFGEVDTPVDGTASQTVAGVPGNTYTFSGWSRFEVNYSGGVDTIDPANPNGDAGKPSPTTTTMSIEFLDSLNVVIDTEVLDLELDRIALNGGPTANDNLWWEHEMSAVAPAGTAFVRVTAGMYDGVFNVDPGQTAFFDDFVLEASVGGTPGDFDGDGDVDGRDFLAWQRGNSPSPFSAGDLATWQGAYNGGALAAVTSVPEPTTLLSLAVGLVVCGLSRRGQRA